MAERSNGDVAREAARAATGDSEQHDPFANDRLPHFTHSNVSEHSKELVAKQGACGALLESMSSLGDHSMNINNKRLHVDATGGPAALLKMSQTDLNSCADSAPKGFHSKKDSKGDVTYLGYSKPAEHIAKSTDPVAAKIYGFIADAGINGAHAVKNAIHGDDASVKIQPGKQGGAEAIFKQWGYEIMGSDTVHVKLKH